MKLLLVTKQFLVSEPVAGNKVTVEYLSVSGADANGGQSIYTSKSSDSKQ